jgi:hypothetical protein
MAEPGRYYAHASHTLVANVIGRKAGGGGGGGQEGGAPFKYYINDGIYGAPAAAAALAPPITAPPTPAPPLRGHPGRCSPNNQAPLPVSTPRPLSDPASCRSP